MGEMTTRSVILSEAKDPQVSGRGLSLGTMKILPFVADAPQGRRLTAQDDNMV
jgi:hypothetical protein